MSKISAISSRPAGLPDNLRFDVDASGYAVDRSGRPGGKPLGVVHLASTDELENLLLWANKAAVPLIPVSSRGGLRRRGDTIAPRPALIADLSGMNRVVNVDARDAVAVIEAGVTFPELDAALKPHGLKAFTPLLPRGSKSVMAAFLEREPITTPGHHWDSADPLASLELVFGNGERFRTGGAALPGTIEENLERGNRQLLNSGPGQTDFGRVVQGAQGSLAIVARGSILCRRIPAVSVPWFVCSETLGPVVETAYAMLRKRHDGHLFIVNRTQLASMMSADPVAFAKLRLAPESALKLPAWSMFIELSADSHFTQAAMAYRTSDLKAAAASAGAQLCQEIGGQSATALASTLDRYSDGFYKERMGQAYDDVFFLSQLNRVQRLLDAVANLADPVDVGVYLQPMTQGVNAHCEFTFLAKDRATASATARQAAERFAATGVFYSRPYYLWADLAFAKDTHIRHLLKQTKELFDPAGVLQPQSQALGLSTAPAFAAI